VLVGAAGCVLVWLAILVDAAPEMIDLAVYQWAGGVARDSQELYRSAWNDFLPFLYPPFAAVAFMPLAGVPFPVLQVLSVALGLGAIVAVVHVSLVSLGYAHDPQRTVLAMAVLAVAVWLEPVTQTIEFGQVNLVLLALVVVDLCLPDTNRWKGVGVGLAAAFKLTSLAFVPFLVLSGRRSAAARAVGVFAATVAAGVALLPVESRQYWLDGVFSDSSRVGAAYVSNQSINGFWLRVAGSAEGAFWPWLIGSVIVGGLGMAAAVVLARRGHELAGVTMCGLTALVVSPISWSHHWVWLVPALVLGLDVARRWTGWRVRVGLGALVAVFGVVPFHPGVLWHVPRGGDQEEDWNAIQLIIGNLYLIAALVVIAVVVTGIVRSGWLRSRT
jgi:alpha-1,2-mannosyltransferase